MAKLTVGKLREALKDVPDELEINLWSDSGVDQDPYGDSEVVIENAFRHQHKLPEGETYADGTNGVDYFVIYCNWREEGEQDVK